jgi:NTP pyrophosphatase (non-canonical NTP hydrolase)
VVWILCSKGDVDMDATEYQRLASRTLIDSPDAEYTNLETMLVWNALGLTGESGEVADIIKKAVFHRHGLDDATMQKLIKELGDVLWYVAAICSKINVPMNTVMECNIYKLMQRYPEGYSSDASINRKEQSE